jgi:MFS-type transporter involved in bile tolerance (Atg22 family)
MLANYFGQSKFATLMGILSLFHNSFMFISPLYAGWLRDSTNSYSVALLTFAPMFAIGAISFALAKKPIHR